LMFRLSVRSIKTDRVTLLLLIETSIIPDSYANCKSLNAPYRNSQKSSCKGAGFGLYKTHYL
jgi:hypothetical protein